MIFVERRTKSSIHQIRAAKSESYNTRTMYHSTIKGIAPNIIMYNNRIPHYDAPKKKDTE